MCSPPRPACDATTPSGRAAPHGREEAYQLQGGGLSAQHSAKPLGLFLDNRANTRAPPPHEEQHDSAGAHARIAPWCSSTATSTPPFDARVSRRRSFSARRRRTAARRPASRTPPSVLKARHYVQQQKAYKAGEQKEQQKQQALGQSSSEPVQSTHRCCAGARVDDSSGEEGMSERGAATQQQGSATWVPGQAGPNAAGRQCGDAVRAAMAEGGGRDGHLGAPHDTRLCRWASSH